MKPSRESRAGAPATRPAAVGEQDDAERDDAADEADGDGGDPHCPATSWAGSFAPRGGSHRSRPTRPRAEGTGHVPCCGQRARPRIAHLRASALRRSTCAASSCPVSSQRVARRETPSGARRLDDGDGTPDGTRMSRGDRVPAREGRRRLHPRAARRGRGDCTADAIAALRVELDARADLGPLWADGRALFRTAAPTRSQARSTAGRRPRSRARRSARPISSSRSVTVAIRPSPVQADRRRDLDTRPAESGVRVTTTSAATPTA